MTFGSQTISFITLVGSGTYDELGGETTTTTTVSVAGCHHRPLRADEMPDWLTNIATQVWKTTAPPVAAALAAESTGLLTVDGQTFQILAGAQPFPDFAGNPFKVTILSQIQTA